MLVFAPNFVRSRSAHQIDVPLILIVASIQVNLPAPNCLVAGSRLQANSAKRAVADYFE